MDLDTVQKWVDEIGYRADLENATTLRIRAREGGFSELPPFFIQYTGEWVVLSMLEVFGKEAVLIEGLSLRLLEANREMRLAKFALGEDDKVLLCAELPTESLDRSELSDAVDRLIEYAATYRGMLLGVPGRRPLTSG
jgi:hypothetical protein